MSSGWADWQVLVVGGGPDRVELEARSHAMGLQDLVRFVGERDDVVPWLQALDLFVLPSTGQEGVPQAIMQAMACGIPVVSTTVGAITEAVDDGVTGLIVPPRDVATLGAALAQLRDDAPGRVRLGSAGRARAVLNFGIDRMLDDMEKVFRRTLGAKV